MPPHSRKSRHLPPRIEQKRARVHSLAKGRPRESAAINSVRELRTYFAQSWTISHAVQGWSESMLAFVTDHERMLGEIQVSRAKAGLWGREQNGWLRAQLKIVERRKQFWSRRIESAKQMQVRALRGLALSKNPEKRDSLLRTFERILQKFQRTLDESAAISIKMEALRKKGAPLPKPLKKEFLESALRRIRANLKVCEAQVAAYRKHGITLSPERKGKIFLQIKEAREDEKEIRSLIDEYDSRRGNRDEGGDQLLGV